MNRPGFDDLEDTDEFDDTRTISDELRDGIQKQLRRSDLSAEDRASYEAALKKLNAEEQRTL